MVAPYSYVHVTDQLSVLVAPDDVTARMVISLKG